jgi:hypothetical protein
MRPMPGRALVIASRMIFFLCGATSLFTCVPYVIMRGVDLPYQSEWIIFVVALALVGLGSIAAAVLPRSWIAKASRQERDDQRLFSVPLKLLGIFAAIFYLVALVAYFAPHTWNLDSQLMLVLCPMYFVKMTFDPSAVAVFFLLAPMNAAVFGSLGLTLGYASLAFRRRP